jgi:hypothetical protein
MASVPTINITTDITIAVTGRLRNMFPELGLLIRLFLLVAAFYSCNSISFMWLTKKTTTAPL